MTVLEHALSSFNNVKLENLNLCHRIFDDLSSNVQNKKLDQSLVFDINERNKIIEQLKVRPALLVHIANFMRDQGVSVKNFVEVGTAQGMQSACFAGCFSDAHVYTCDIKDDRSENIKNIDNIHFYKTNSLEMVNLLPDDVKFDFCWVDGSHDAYDVIEDYLSLSKRSHKETVWVFDDFDQRFGCFNDIQILARHFKESYVIDLGLTASCYPNRIAIMKN